MSKKDILNICVNNNTSIERTKAIENFIRNSNIPREEILQTIVELKEGDYIVATIAYGDGTVAEYAIEDVTRKGYDYL